MSSAHRNSAHSFSHLPDFENSEEESHCPYAVGDHVMLQRPDRHQKRLAPYERGWTVKEIVSPTTVVIEKPSPDNRRVSKKVINIALLKKDLPDAAATEASLNSDEQDDNGIGVSIDVAPTGGYALRPRVKLQAPARYRV